jgi:hypothetical protein
MAAVCSLQFDPSFLQFLLAMLLEMHNVPYLTIRTCLLQDESFFVNSVDII